MRTDPPCIEVSHLGKTYRVREQDTGFTGALRGIVSPQYRTVTALQDVTFTVGPGEIVGFLGPNGAGKTTTLKCLTGLLTPTSGTLRVLGFDPARRAYAFRRRFALVLGQKSGLWWDVPAREGFLLQKEIYEIPTDRYRAHLADLVDALGVAHLLSVPVRQLSLGERMKMELITGLLHQPELLFLDEPTIGLDLVSQDRVRRFLRAHNAHHGTTIVLTSHYMEDIRALCPRIVVLGGGSVAYDGPLQALAARYGGGAERRVRVTFAKEVAKADLDRFSPARVAALDPGPPPTAELAARAEDVPAVSAALLSALPVVDIAISEPSADDILRRLYQGQAMA